MRPAILGGALSALAVLAACGDAAPLAPVSAPGAAPLYAAAPGGAIPGEYIVVLREGASPDAVAAVAGVRPRHAYAAALNGFAAALSPGQLAALRHHPAVEYVEEDQVVTARQSAPWNLDRIDQPNLPLDGQYLVNTGAPGVHAYIIDTGINHLHPEFGGRASNVFDAFGGNGQDCHGHGTGVAGVVGSTTWGVAKLVKLRGVRVLNCSGSGSTSGVIAGIDWVRVNAVHPAVANLSLQGGASSAMNNAVTNLFLSEVLVTVPAGNSNANACNLSPSGALGATTVGATTPSDAVTALSNWGPCVHIFAPGSTITTVGLGKAPVTISGSSLAAPHVAGVGALVFDTFGGSAGWVRNWILSNATVGVLSNVPPNTPNRLLYTAGL